MAKKLGKTDPINGLCALGEIAPLCLHFLPQVLGNWGEPNAFVSFFRKIIKA